MQENPLFILADWVHSTKATWQDHSLQAANRAFIDLFACMIAGRDEEVSLKSLSLAKNWGLGSCPVLGHSEKLSPPMAAFVNGTTAHALDFDDDFDPAKCHPSAAIIPAILSVAATAEGNNQQKSGQDLLDAYIIGLEVTGRVGQALNPYHRRRGWHATATIGSIGAAAACARLMNLNALQTRHSLSAATSLMGGFMSQFGSMIKPMHAGLAAMRGVMAADMAATGITAGDHTFDGPFGLRALMIGPDADARADEMADIDEYGQKSRFNLDQLGKTLIIDDFGLKVKQYPNCGSIHRALDNLLILRKQHGFTADDIQSIHVDAPASHMRNLPYDHPITAMEAKFSLPHALALGVLQGQITLDDYQAEKILSPQITALYPKISRTAIQKMESECPTVTTVTLKDGQSISAQRFHPIGSYDTPLSDDQIWQKFWGCAQGQTVPEGLTTFLINMQQSRHCQPLLSSLPLIKAA